MKTQPYILPNSALTLAKIKSKEQREGCSTQPSRHSYLRSHSASLRELQSRISNPTPLAHTRPSTGRSVGRQARYGGYSL